MRLRQPSWMRHRETAGRLEPVRRARRLCLLALALFVALLVVVPSPWQVEGGPGLVPGDDRPFEFSVWIALWWGALVNVGLAALLAALAPLWARPLSRSLPEVRVPAVGRGFIACLLLAMAVAGALRWPLANGSLWWDEGWSITRVVRGPVAPSAEDPSQLELDARHWARTIWYWKKPTNHVLYNISARASLDTWRLARGLGPEAHSDLVFRLPALAAALLTVAATGLLGWRFGFWRAGLAAALLVALHPWALRYSVEGRAYTFAMLWALLAALALCEALRSGHWRAWLGYAVAQWLLLWSHPFLIYLTFVMGVAGLVGIALAQVPGRDRITLGFRLVVSNLLAAMALIAVMAPNLAQVFIWDDEANGRPLNRGVLVELWSRMAAGLPFQSSPEADPTSAWPSLMGLAAAHPVLPYLVFGVVPALALLGLARLLRRPGPARVVATALVATVPLSMAVIHATGQIYYARFMTFALAPLLVLVCVGLETLARLALPVAWRPLGRAALLASGLAVLGAIYTPQLEIVTTRPIAPLRDVGRYLTARAGDDPLSVLRAGYGLGGGMPKIYDPFIRYVHTRTEIAALCREADERGVPLYVFYGQPGFNRAHWPDGFALLDDPRIFEPEVRFDAVEPRFTYRVLRYTGVPPAS